MQALPNPYGNAPMYWQVVLLDEPGSLFWTMKGIFGQNGILGKANNA
jgi:hypothetical protein